MDRSVRRKRPFARQPFVDKLAFLHPTMSTKVVPTPNARPIAATPAQHAVSSGRRSSAKTKYAVRARFTGRLYLYCRFDDFLTFRFSGVVLISHRTVSVLGAIFIQSSILMVIFTGTSLVCSSLFSLILLGC